MENKHIAGLSLEEIYDARRALQGITRQTPIIGAPQIGANISIKAENLQLTGSFKLRGAYNKICRLSRSERESGIIACSAGNHAQGVALAAKRLSIRATICMPAAAPLSKIEATRGYGAEVVLVQGAFDDAYTEAKRLADERGLTFVHPFDDNDIIAGQGTVGLEILDQMPEADIIFVPIGGGGLVSGIACAVKTLKPKCKVIGVQASGVPSMLASRISDEIVELDSAVTIADGIAVKKPGKLTFDYCNRYVDEIVTVTEEEIASAILLLMEANKTVAEGAGAAAVAAAMFEKFQTKRENTVCVVSGGNIDVNILERVITQGLAKSGRITQLNSKISDKPNQLASLLNVIAGAGANVMSIDHNRRDKKGGIDSVLVHCVLETKNPDHSIEVVNAVTEAGYEIF